ncbi:MAG: transposase [Hydrococcus sp. C42_A2020_068]|nr:transposase [Hydrococcus sp. C42_A2020_068]
MIISDDSPTTAITDYGKRWSVETLFGMLKTRGFGLESTHLTDSQRLSKLLALMSLA